MTSNIEYYTGIDIGGSGSRGIAICAKTNKPLIDLIEIKTNDNDGPVGVLKGIKELKEKILDSLKIKFATEQNNECVREMGVGLCTPGPANKFGKIGKAGTPNLKGWEDFCWTDAYSEFFKPKNDLQYINDGSSAVLACASHFKSSNVVGAIVGTGCGGGAIVDGKVQIGYDGRSTEFGHLYVPLTGVLLPEQELPVCGCGQVGDVESFLSVRGLEKNLPAFFRLFKLRNKNVNHELENMTLYDASYAVRAYAESGDELALAIFRQQAQIMGRLFVQLARIYDPELYIIGGGLSATNEFFKSFFKGTVIREMAEYLSVEQLKYSKVEFAPDDDKAGAIGAALYAKQALTLSSVF